MTPEQLAEAVEEVVNSHEFDLALGRAAGWSTRVEKVTRTGNLVIFTTDKDQTLTLQANRAPQSRYL
jgi:hypothetical protein